MDLRELADFLRSRRARVQPAEAGLQAGPRRRTPGLRREEVAQLAGISSNYYTRLEQARAPRPSCTVQHGLARALRLSAAERSYLFTLVRDGADRGLGPPQEVPAGILGLLDRFEGTPVYVLDAKWDVLAANTSADTVLGGAAGGSGRNVLRDLFLPATKPGDLDSVEEAWARIGVADLRGAAVRYPDDPDVHGLVNELRTVSPLFEEMWDAHDVRTGRDVDQRILLVPEHDQRLVFDKA